MMITDLYNKIIVGDSAETLKTFPDDSIDCCVTSPPYFGLRDYDVDGQIGLESNPEAYIERLMNVFNQVHRVLKPDGTFWLNIADSYNGSGKANGCDLTKYLQNSNRAAQKPKPTHVKGLKKKDLIGIPWMLAFALRESGWYLRQEIIWHKPNPMPESVRDRCTKSHESLFLLSKSSQYYFDNQAIMEPAKYDGRKDTTAKGSPKYMQISGTQIQGLAKREHERWPNKIRGYAAKENEQTGLPEQHHGSNMGTYPARNKRDVWIIPTRPFRGAHFATFPTDLIKPCILAGCPVGGVVLDPFFGAGTTGLVAQQLGRNYIGIDLNADYVRIAEQRLRVA